MITFSSNPKPKLSIVTFGIKEIGPYYWVGHCRNGIDYYAGQTFKVPESGALLKIKLFPSVIHGSSDATFQLYGFDTINHTWKDKRSETIKRITKAMENEWVEFDLKGVEVQKNETLGFKLSCKGGMLAIAECPWTKENPFTDGEEWVGSSHLKGGKFQKDFAFAFEGEIEASTNAKFV